MIEEPLRGGHTTDGVVRVGNTVRRPRDGRSEFAARALVALQELGYARSPTYLGIDSDGREVLLFVEGQTTDHPSQRDERCYTAVGALLRDLHERTRGTKIADGGTSLVHGDAAPFNTVMQDGMPTMLIDWDSVHPGDPLEDVGYAGWTWCIQTEGNVPITDQAARLQRFRSGYDDGLDGLTLLTAIQAQQHAIIAAETQVLRDTSTAQGRRRHAATAIAWAQADNELLRRHHETFEDAVLLKVGTSSVKRALRDRSEVHAADRG